jgi:transcriptional regulator with GAF, ATPase, and Fis domain
MIGESQRMREVTSLSPARHRPSTVLICGERTGRTGSRHPSKQPACQPPFIAINCAALMESPGKRIFGHEGAWGHCTKRKLEIADKGQSS